MEVSTEKSKIMTNNVSADISMNCQKLQEVTNSKHLDITVQGWHLLSKNPHQDCIGNGSNG